MEPDDMVEELTAALGRLVAHQLGLRCRITTDGTQLMLPAGDAATEVPLTVVDLRDRIPRQVLDGVNWVREEMAASGPDPATGPPLEVRLVLLPEDAGRLYLSCSLLAVDGWSFAMLVRELLTFCADPNAVLLPLEIDLGDYVEAVERLRATPDREEDRQWWWSRIDTLPCAPALPVAQAPTAVTASRMGAREQRLTPAQWTTLRAACAARSVTPSAALVTAYAVAVARVAGHRRFLLSTLQHARLPLHPDVTRLVGGISATALLSQGYASGVPSTGSRTARTGAGRGLCPGPAEARHVLTNRCAWDRLAGEYEVPETGGLTWGWWRWPEDELQVLGDIAGKAVLDIGCGAATWTVALARHGAHPVGLDSSPRQLEQAQRVIREAGLKLPVVLADAEQLPFADESFDAVACDWGAMGFTDPYRSVPEAARVPRPGGLFAYFDPHRWETPDGMMHFQLPYGAWIRLFRDSGLTVEDLVELPAPNGPIPHYLDEQRRSWSEQWPFECIWKTRKQAPIGPQSPS